MHTRVKANKQFVGQMWSPPAKRSATTLGEENPAVFSALPELKPADRAEDE
jgi:hypothetical protein